MRVIINMARTIGLLSGKLIEGDDPILFSDRMKSVEIKAPCSGLFVAERYELCLLRHRLFGSFWGIEARL